MENTDQMWQPQKPKMEDKNPGFRDMGRTSGNTISRGRKAFKWFPALILGSLIGPGPLSAQRKTTVADALFGLDGTPLNGYLIVKTATAFTSPDGFAVAAGTQTRVNVSNGGFSIQLIPNVGASPAGSSYQVQYFVGAQNVTEAWIVPQTPNPAKLADVRALAPLVPTTQLPIAQVTPPSSCTSSLFLEWMGTGWGCGQSGTVASVQLAVPPEFTVAGSPVTSSGTLAVTKANQLPNLIYASPSGPAGVPAFRSLVTSDLPGTVAQTGSCPASNFVTAVKAGAPTCAPAAPPGLDQIADPAGSKTFNLGGNTLGFTGGNVGIGTSIPMQPLDVKGQARFGSGTALGTPSSACAVSANGAGNLNGTYQWAYTEADNTGETNLSPAVSLTVSNQQVTVVCPMPRRGVGGQRLYRTLAGTATFHLDHVYGGGYFQTTYVDNYSDASISSAVQPPTTDQSGTYDFEAFDGVKFVRSNPNNGNNPADLTILTGNSGYANGTFAIDAYSEIRDRCFITACFSAQTTGDTTTAFVALNQSVVDGTSPTTVWNITAHGTENLVPNQTIDSTPISSVGGTIASTSNPAYGFYLNLTGSGSSANEQDGERLNLNAGYTGPANTNGIVVFNGSAGTGRTTNVRATGGQNSLFFGHSNTQFLASLGAFGASGYPAFCFYCYSTNSGSDAWNYASSTNIPALMWPDVTGKLHYKVAPQGTVDHTIAFGPEAFQLGSNIEIGGIDGMVRVTDASTYAVMMRLATGTPAGCPQATCAQLGAQNATPVQIESGGSQAMLATTTQSVVLGSTGITTSSSAGFPYIPAAAGPPTGVPTAQSGFVPMYYDTANHKLWIYDAGWKGVAVN